MYREAQDTMISKEETLRIIDLLNDTYESEEAWHGPSVVEGLRGVSPRMAESRLTSNTHSIAEIVFHMTTWRIFTVRKLQGDAEFDITNKDKNWKVFTFFDEFEWETLQMELSLSQEELISELEKKENDDFLEDIVPGREYTYYNLLHGIIHHDIYHSGQISLIKKGLALNQDLNDIEDSVNFGDEYDSF